MCRAVLIVRLPPRFESHLALAGAGPDGMGAVPLKRAYASLLRNRVTPDGLAEDHRRAEHAAAGQGQQRGRELGHERPQFSFEGIDLLGKLAAAHEQRADQAGHDTVEGVGELGDHPVAAQATAGDRQAGFEFVQVRSATRSRRWSTMSLTCRVGPPSAATGSSG